LQLRPAANKRLGRITRRVSKVIKDMRPIQAIKSSAAKVQAIKVPKIKVPAIKVPKIKVPAIKVPKIKVPRAKVAQGEKEKVALGGGKKKVAARIAAAFTSCFSRRAVVAEEEEEYSLRLSVDSDESDGEMISVGTYPANSETTSLTAPAEAANCEMVERTTTSITTSITDEWFNQDLSQLSDQQLLAVFEMAVAHDIEPEVRTRTYADAAHGVPVHPRWSALRC